MMPRKPAPTRIGLSPSEFSKQVGVGKTLIYEQIKLGNLPARKIGTRTIILADEGEAWLRGLRNVQLPSADFPQPSRGTRHARRSAVVCRPGRQS
jgi:hypothetical protein